jgi:hypothetical protein
MPKRAIVTARMADNERAMLRALSESDGRSASDILRRLVVKAFEASGLTLPKTSTKKRS